LLTDREIKKTVYRGPSIDASYQVSIHLAKQFQRRRFCRNQPIRNKNGLWRPCLLTDRDEMSNLYRGPAIDASYQVSVHLAKRFQRRRFFLIGQSETKIAYGGHVCWWIRTKWAIFREDLPSYHVSLHLAEGFQRRRLKCEKLTNNKWWQKLTLPLARWAKKNLFFVVGHSMIFLYDNIDAVRSRWNIRFYFTWKSQYFTDIYVIMKYNDNTKYNPGNYSYPVICKYNYFLPLFILHNHN
jgi:hypothetical protein